MSNLFYAHLEAFKRRDFRAFFTFQDPATKEIKVHTKAIDYLNRLTSNDTTDDSFGGGAGGSKSFTTVYWQLMSRFAYPNTRGFFARTSLKLLRGSTSQTFRKVLKKLDVPKELIKFNGTDNFWQFDNGSRIDYIDCTKEPTDPEYERFGSFEFTNGVFEECGAIPYKAFSVLKTRTGRDNNDKYNLTNKVASTFNPTKTWVYQHYYKPYKEAKMPKDRSFIPALVYDNPFAPQTYIQNLESSTDNTIRQRLLYGNFDYDDNDLKLYNYDCIINMFSNYIVQDNSVMRITCDVARFGRDKTIICVWKEWELVKIVTIAQSDLVYVVNEIERLREQYNVSKSNVCVDSDGVGGGVQDFGGYKGFVANSKAVDDRTKEEKEKNPINYSNLKSQCAYKLQDVINNNLIRISANISIEDKELLIEDLDSYEAYKVDNDSKMSIIPKEKQKEKLGRSPDFGDNFLIRMSQELVPAVEFYDQMYL
jgi:phage terminase large subunit